MELAYAPPFSTPKDPINFLGYIAENLADNLVKTFSWRDVDQLITNQAYFLDVREPDEIALGKIDNSHAIPLAQLREQLTSLPTDRPIYVYCQVGIRGYIATQILHAHGFMLSIWTVAIRLISSPIIKLKPNLSPHQFPQ